MDVFMSPQPRCRRPSIFLSFVRFLISLLKRLLPPEILLYFMTLSASRKKTTTKRLKCEKASLCACETTADYKYA